MRALRASCNRMCLFLRDSIGDGYMDYKRQQLTSLSHSAIIQNLSMAALSLPFSYMIPSRSELSCLFVLFFCIGDLKQGGLSL